MDTIGLVMIDKVNLECIIARNRSNPNKNMFENYNTVSNFYTALGSVTLFFSTVIYPGLPFTGRTHT